MLCHCQQIRIIVRLGLGLAREQLVEERLQISPVAIASTPQDFDNLLIRRRFLDFLELKLGCAHNCKDHSGIGSALQTL